LEILWQKGRVIEEDEDKSKKSKKSKKKKDERIPEYFLSYY
jgi:hypothetical protein